MPLSFKQRKRRAQRSFTPKTFPMAKHTGQCESSIRCEPPRELTSVGGSQRCSYLSRLSVVKRCVGHDKSHRDEPSERRRLPWTAQSWLSVARSGAELVNPFEA